MATIKQLSSGSFQIRVVSKLLPKAFYATFESREQAVAYSDHLRALLAKGLFRKRWLKKKEQYALTGQLRDVLPSTFEASRFQSPIHSIVRTYTFDLKIQLASA